MEMVAPILLAILLGVAAAVKNPIIPGWNPDPHILRVGDEYFIATSTFEYFPGTAIYRSTDLAGWELHSHAATRPSQSLLYGVPGSAGAWAPSLSRVNGTFYLALAQRWVYDPVAKAWPRVYFLASPDLVRWSAEPVWCEPWGIDPHVFEDPVSRRAYLTLMAPNNDVDRVWGIAQCEVSLATGRCVGGGYRSVWNGTLEHDSGARPEGPKMFYREPWYYLLIAEGGTSDNHQATIARSQSPEGPWDPAPNNPLVFNGQYGVDNLTVQSTGHATFVEGKDGNWFTSFLARRKVGGSDPLGRETFLASVTWEDGWPVINGGKPILLSEEIPGTPEFDKLPSVWTDEFEGDDLDISWYQLRTPYTTNFYVGCPKDEEGGGSTGWDGGAAFTRRSNCSSDGLTFVPNVYGLSDRDTPAAILRKQRSLNMTFSATPWLSDGAMGPRQSVGISAYLSEFQHQDIGLRGCTNTTGICVYHVLHMGDETETDEALIGDDVNIANDLTFHIRAEPLQYSLGFSTGQAEPEWLATIDASWQAYHPSGFSVFTGTSFALFASGGGEPWPVDGAQVGFRKVTEEYYEENIPDYDVW